jgi:hypothetical protein
VLGVEVVRHAASAGELVAYEPVVRGRTSTSQRSRKGPSERRTEAEFEDVLEANHGEAVLAAVKELISQTSERHKGFVSIGTSAKSPRLFFNYRTGGDGRTYWPLAINPRPGKLVLFLRYLRHHPSFEDDDIRAEFVERMAAAVGHELSGDNLGGFPWAPVSLLATPGTTDRIVEVLDWVTATANAGGEGTSR